MHNLKVGTINVRGIRDDSKRRNIFQYLRERQYDIIFMQELHSTKNEEIYWRAQWGGPMYFSHYKSNSRGVAILINKKSKIDVKKVGNDKEGRIVEVNVQTEQHKFHMINIYAPNEDKPQFFLDVGNRPEINEIHNKIIGGDFNLVLDEEKDRLNTTEVNKVAQVAVKAVAENFNMIDIWRINNPEERKYTWARRNPQIKMARLDYFLVSNQLQNSIKHIQITPGFRTDHSIVSFMLTENVVGRGKGFWKLNCSLLKEKQFVQNIEEIIDKENQQLYDKPSQRLDMIKLAVRTYAIQYSSRKQKSRENTLKIFDKKLIDYEKQLQKIAEDRNTILTKQQIMDRIEIVERERQELIQYKVRGSMIRARKNYHRYGEKSSKYFFGLERQNFRKKE